MKIWYLKVTTGQFSEVMTTSLAVKLLGMSTHLKMSTNVTITFLSLCAGDRERILLILEKVK